MPTFNVRKVLDFVRSNYDGETGGFRQAPHAIDSLYSLSFAIATFNLLLQHRDEKLPYEVLERELGADVMKNICAYIKRCQQEDGGFADRPYTDSSISSTVNGVKTLRRFLPSAEGENEEKRTALAQETISFARDKGIDLERAIEFTLRCYGSETFPQVISDGQITRIGHETFQYKGFKERPDAPELHLASTYFALRTLNELERVRAIKERYGKNAPIDIVNFINACWTQDANVGGYAPRPRLIRHIHDTDFALESFLIMKPHLPQEVVSEIENNARAYAPKVVAFIMASKGKDREGGFGFREGKRSESNIYSTKKALDALEALSELTGQVIALTPRTMEKVRQFVLKTYSPEIGGFAGYAQP